MAAHKRQSISELTRGRMPAASAGRRARVHTDQHVAGDITLEENAVLGPAGEAGSQEIWNGVSAAQDTRTSDFERSQVRTISHSAFARAADVAAVLSGPLAAAIVTRSVGLFIAAAAIVMIVRSRARAVGLHNNAIEVIGPVVATLSVFVVAGLDSLTYSDPHSNVWMATLVAAVLSIGCALLVSMVGRRFAKANVAVIGSARQARQLAADLKAANVKHYRVVGYIEQTALTPFTAMDDDSAGSSRFLGGLDAVGEIAERENIGLLVLPQGGDRLAVFDKIASSTDRGRTRLVSLSAFNEYVFQRVPIEELNSAWLQHIMHPHFRPAPAIVIRALDILGAGFIALITLPLWAIAALAIRIEDGKPIFYRQVRTGAMGKPFTMVKFRSMRVDAEAGGAQWSSGADDDRVTKVGKIIRRFHVDELPQLLNVLRGDMSLVGPRPERPEFVSRLEEDIPFYGRRHLIKPGVTGWAQIRAGYGLTDEGQTVKLSQDLFYLKHQSVLLYVYVLLATCGTVTRGTVHSRAH